MVEIHVPLIEKLVDVASEWLRRDRRKTLPQREVVLGQFSKKDLEVDVCAEIVLGETIAADVELFLRRIRLGRPYCPRCSRPLEQWNADWMSDFAQIGYRCRPCGTQINGNHSVLLDDVSGDVRRGFLDYWTRYQEAIRLLTRGKDRKFKLPQ